MNNCELKKNYNNNNEKHFDIKMYVDNQIGFNIKFITIYMYSKLT